MVVVYRRFGTAYFQGSESPRKMRGIDGSVAVSKKRETSTDIRCVTLQKSEDLIYTVAEA
jgi:hypothetical protein